MRKVSKAKAEAMKAAETEGSPKRSAAAAAKNYVDGSDTDDEGKHATAKNGKNAHDGDELDESESESYEVESILGSRVRHGKRQFKIRWKGFGPADDTWEDEENIDSPTLIAAYLQGPPDVKVKKTVLPKSKKIPKKKGTKRGAPSDSSLSKKVKHEDGSETDDWEVSKIIDDVELKDGTRQYLVKWKGFSSKANSWEPESNLDCPDLIKKYLETVEKREKTSSDRETRKERKQVFKYSPYLSKRKSHRSVKSGGVDITSHRNQQQQDDASFSSLDLRHPASSWIRSRAGYNLNMASSPKSTQWFSKFSSQCSVM